MLLLGIWSLARPRQTARAEQGLPPPFFLLLPLPWARFPPSSGLFLSGRKRKRTPCKYERSQTRSLLLPPPPPAPAPARPPPQPLCFIGLCPWVSIALGSNGMETGGGGRGRDRLGTHPSSFCQGQFRASPPLPPVARFAMAHFSLPPLYNPPADNYLRPGLKWAFFSLMRQGKKVKSTFFVRYGKQVSLRILIFSTLSWQARWPFSSL